MYYLKNKYFIRWAKKERITDHVLIEAIHEFENGLFEASLGNHLFKKRISLLGRGKSSGARTILFYQKGMKLIFCFGFSKNRQDNLTNLESKLINQMSQIYQDITEEAVAINIQQKKFVQILTEAQ